MQRWRIGLAARTCITREQFPWSLIAASITTTCGANERITIRLTSHMRRPLDTASEN
jgi:hypothetical protein